MNASLMWKLHLGEQGILSPGKWLLPRALLWTLLLFAFTLFALFASYQLSDWLNLPASANYLTALFIPPATIIGYIGAVRYGECRAASEFSMREAPREIIIGFLLGVAFIGLVLALLWSLGIYHVGLGHWRRWYDYLPFNAYISGLLEELAFRAILLRILAKFLGPVGGLAASALLFGAAHAGHASWMAVIQIVINAGLVMGLLYMVSGRLWLSIGLPIGYDFTEWSIMGVGDKNGLLAISPARGSSDLLSGGSFGPDGSVFAGIVGLVMLLGIWAAYRQRGRLTSSGPENAGCEPGRKSQS